MLAILIAIVGMVMAGIMVSIAVWAAHQAFAIVHDAVAIEALIEQIPE